MHLVNAGLLARIEDDPLPFIAAVRDFEPLLSPEGYEGPNTLHCAGRTFDQQRAAMTDDYHAGEFVRAAQWLAQTPRVKAVNHRFTSYGWKHVAERWYRQMAPVEVENYISNGMFIAACHVMGCKVKVADGGPNALINLPMSAVGRPI